jgi:Fe2+ or Zn2+ uptake regulation protein
MTSLPGWIDDRLDHGLGKKLTQRHVIETMLEAERPFFSTEQVRARVRPDVSRETVRNRLNELREIDVVAAETYPESITLYYVNHPESNWPLSPEGKRALNHETALETLSLGDFVRLRNPAGIRTLVLAGFQMSLVLFALGTLTLVFTYDPAIGGDVGFWNAAGNLFLVSVLLLFAERIARRIRKSGFVPNVPTRREFDSN